MGGVARGSVLATVFQVLVGVWVGVYCFVASVKHSKPGSALLYCTYVHIPDLIVNCEIPWRFEFYCDFHVCAAYSVYSPRGELVVVG